MTLEEIISSIAEGLASPITRYHEDEIERERTQLYFELRSEEIINERKREQYTHEEFMADHKERMQHYELLNNIFKYYLSTGDDIRDLLRNTDIRYLE